MNVKMPKPKTITTPLTNIEIDYATRWQNRTFFAEYQRLRRRKKGLKQRIRKCDDGTLLRDRHPELCVRESKYVYSKPWTCQLCNVTMLDGYRERHLNGKLHERMVEQTDYIQKHEPEENHISFFSYASCYNDIIEQMKSR